MNTAEAAANVLAAIREPDGKLSLWNEAMAARPAGPLPFLDPAALPRDTSLQRTLAGFLERGGQWRGGGMFLLPDDMRRPREGLYRERFQSLRPELGLA